MNTHAIVWEDLLASTVVSVRGLSNRVWPLFFLEKGYIRTENTTKPLLKPPPTTQNSPPHYLSSFVVTPNHKNACKVQHAVRKQWFQEVHCIQLSTKYLPSEYSKKPPNNIHIYIILLPSIYYRRTQSLLWSRDYLVACLAKNKKSRKKLIHHNTEGRGGKKPLFLLHHCLLSK